MGQGEEQVRQDVERLKMRILRLERAQEKALKSSEKALEKAAEAMRLGMAMWTLAEICSAGRRTSGPCGGSSSSS